MSLLSVQSFKNLTSQMARNQRLLFCNLKSINLGLCEPSGQHTGLSSQRSAVEISTSEEKDVFQISAPQQIKLYYQHTGHKMFVSRSGGKKVVWLPALLCRGQVRGH